MYFTFAHVPKRLTTSQTLTVHQAHEAPLSIMIHHHEDKEEKKEVKSFKDVANERPSWQTGAANAERKKKNLAAKKSSKKQAASKIDRESDAKELGAQDAKEEKRDERPIVVHPWHLQFVKHSWRDNHHVSLDDAKTGHGVYEVAQHADNLEGTGLFRRIKGQGHVPLSRTWGNLEYVRRACAPLAGQALGKIDIDLRHLVPSAMFNLKAWCAPWPGVEIEIAEYLSSSEFRKAVLKHYANGLDGVDDILFAKCLRYAAKVNGTHKDARRAFALYRHPRKEGSLALAALLILVVVACFAFQYFIKSPSYFSACTVLGVVGLWYWFDWYYTINISVVKIYSELYKESFAVNYASVVHIMASCSKGIELPELLTAWKYKLSAGKQELACKLKPAYETFGTYIRGANMVIPNACHHDQYNGLAIRFFFARSYDEKAVMSLMVAARDFCMKKLNPGGWIMYGYDEWVSHLTGKRANLLRAASTLVDVAMGILVDIFVKLEAYLGKNPDCFKPRIIMGRLLEYQNMVGAFFYSASKWLGRVLNVKNSNFIYDSGLDANELGDLATKMFTDYKYVYEIDVSNWDGSLIPQWLDFEIWLIEEVFPYLPHRWREIRRFWKSVGGKGKLGVSYSTRHGRRSGDMWTSCFNSLINLCILYWIFGDDILAVAKGDDNYFGTNSDLTVEEIVAIYASIGMKAKVKRISHISKLGYCSGTFYPVEGGWKWGLKPFRILAKLGLNLHRHPAKIHKRLLLGTAVSMLPIGGHVPVLGDLLRSIVSAGLGDETQMLMPENEFWKTTSETVDPIHPTALSIFCTNYSMSEEELEVCRYLCTYNWRTHEPLQLKDFPIVFSEPAFLKGFQKDADVDVVPDCSNISCCDKPVSHSTFNLTDYLLKVVVAPLGEELVRSQFPIGSTILFGLLETVLVGDPLHLLLHLTFLFGYWMGGVPLAVAVHVWWNFTVWLLYDSKERRRRVGYGSLSHTVWMRRDTLLRRGTGIFIPILDRVVPSNNRLTRDTQNASSLWCFGGCMRNEHTKKNSNQRPKKSGKSKPTSKKGSLGRSLLSGALGGLGALAGPMGAKVGASLGDWGANILGMGDYEVKHNTLLEGNGVPRVHAGKNSVTISHREFLGDITGSTGFSSRVFTLNPGSSVTFPWLSNIAGMFQSYRFKGLIFTFNSTSADALSSVNTALGSVIMSTQYNVALPTFLNKAEMEQYEYTVSGRPSKNLVHCVECDPHLQVMEHLFTRTGSLPVGQDYQFYDWGNFQFATVGMQAAATIGELWVSYEVEFLKPRIASGGTWPGDFTRIANGPYDATDDVLGAIQTNPVGNLGVTVTAGASGYQRIFFPSSITAGRFYVFVKWVGGVAAAIAHPTRTYSNCAPQLTWQLGAATESLTPPGGTNSTGYSYSAMVTIDGYSEGGSYIEFGTAGTLPATPASVDILVVGMPLTNSVF